MPLDSPSAKAFVPCTQEGPGDKHWVGSNGEWVAVVQEQARWSLLNVYTDEEIPLPSVHNVGIVPDGPFLYRYDLAHMQLLKIQITAEPYRVGNKWNYYVIAVFDKMIAIMRGGSRDVQWRILRNDYLAPSRYVDAILTSGRIYAVTAPRGDVLVWDPTIWGEFLIFVLIVFFFFISSLTLHCFLHHVFLIVI
jgi:hypothetical protein